MVQFVGLLVCLQRLLLLATLEYLQEHDVSAEMQIEALTRPLTRPILPILTDLSDFLGRLQSSKTTIQKTLNTLGVE